MAAKIGDEVPAALASAEVLDARGTATTLGERWREGPVVLVFLRHFACLACTEHVTLLAPRLHELRRLGLRVVYVGNGAPHFMDAFVERTAIDLEAVDLVTDPSLAAHETLSLVHSTASAYGPRALWGLARALAGGFRQSRIEGDNLQQGGVVVIDRHGCIAYLHRDRATGDHAPTNDVVDAAMRVAAADHTVV
ncbi:MAG: peroxiredoxin-like family protein [Myxococcota bacterium]